MDLPPAVARHRRLEALFATAAALPAAERAPFARDACGGDADLQRDLLALLGYAEDPRSFLDPGGHRDPADAMPARIGAYRLLRLLGQGGMGTVYLAEQEEPVQRQVALKLVRRGMAAPQILARFQIERQALARMNHDFVARVFDTGVTDGGEPWFAMEFVDGEPIDRHCDRLQRPVRDRLRLFAQVCEGVQHAHQKGVLHRDLKPGNVLVATQGDRAVPKVIDFGLARAVDPTATALGAATRVPLHPDGLRASLAMGTPGYMSPEQERGEAVDTRTDIHALGVVLRELLIGAPAATAGATSRPSTALRGDGDVARRRGTTTAGLRRQLRAGLDWIVVKATDADPERRYASVSELAADVRRYLRHEPLQAGPPGIVYRLRTFVRRQRLWLAVATATLLVAAIGFVAWVREADAAVRAADDAQAVNDYVLEDLLSRARPENSLGRKITVEEVVREAADNIGQRFADHPIREAAVRDVLRVSFAKLGLWDRAIEQGQRCLDLRREHLGDGDRATLTAEADLGDLLTQHDQSARGLPLLQHAAGELRRRYGDDDVDALDARMLLAAARCALGRSDEGEAELAAVVAARTRLFGFDDPRTLSARVKASKVLINRKALAEALPLERGILDARKRVLGELHPDTLTTMNNLASVLLNLDRLDEARAVYEELQPRSLQVHGRSQQYCYVLNNYGICLQRCAFAAMRRHDEAARQELLDRAEATLTDNLELRRQVFGERHSATLTAMANLGPVYFDRHQFDRAASLAESTLALQRELLGDESPQILATWNNLAMALKESGRVDEAEQQLRTMLQVCRKQLESDRLGRGVVHTTLGWLCDHKGDAADAERELLQAYDDLHVSADDPHVRTRDVMRDLVSLYQRLHRDDEAALWQQRLQAAEATVPAGSGATAGDIPLPKK